MRSVLFLLGSLTAVFAARGLDCHVKQGCSECVSTGEDACYWCPTDKKCITSQEYEFTSSCSTAIFDEVTCPDYKQGQSFGVLQVGTSIPGSRDGPAFTSIVTGTELPGNREIDGDDWVVPEETATSIPDMTETQLPGDRDIGDDDGWVLPEETATSIPDMTETQLPGDRGIDDGWVLPEETATSIPDMTETQLPGDRDGKDGWVLPEETATSIPDSTALVTEPLDRSGEVGGDVDCSMGVDCASCASMPQCFWCQGETSSCLSGTNPDLVSRFECPMLHFDVDTCVVDVADLETPDEPEEESMKACSELGWDISMFGTCGSSIKDDDGECIGFKTYDEAVEECAQHGGRLCTAPELDANRGKGTGCSDDVDRVWTASECESGHITQAGSRGGQVEEEPRCDLDTRRHDVRCCADEPAFSVDLPSRRARTCMELDWPAIPGHPQVCASSDLLGECFPYAKYQHAEAVCASVGARLCSASELLNDEARGSGCKLDTERIWTNTECPNGGGILTAAGSSKALKDEPLLCASKNMYAGIRCCADNPELSDSFSCEDLGWPVVDGMCAKSKILGECHSLDFASAQYMCASQGARLCSLEEAEAGVFTGSGCKFDNTPAWTSSECMMGVSTFGGEEAACDDPSTEKAVRCCAESHSSSLSRAPRASSVARVNMEATLQQLSGVDFDSFMVEYKRPSSSLWSSNGQTLSRDTRSFQVSKLASNKDYLVRVTPIRGEQALEQYSTHFRVSAKAQQ